MCWMAGEKPTAAKPATMNEAENAPMSMAVTGSLYLCITRPMNTGRKPWNIGGIEVRPKAARPEPVRESANMAATATMAPQMA